MKHKLHYPETLYETPSGWGEIMVMGEEDVTITIAELKKISGEWLDIKKDDCTTYTHQEKGTYRLNGVRKDCLYQALHKDRGLWEMVEL